MFRWKRERVPEGGAIEDSEAMSAEEYGRVMLKRLGSEYRRFAARIVERGNPPDGGQVLEIGPGPGWVSVFVSQARPDLRVIAVDASPDMVRAATANFSEAGISDRASVFIGSVEQLSAAAPGPFDLIYSRDSLHHWIDPLAAFTQIRTALKAGGSLVLSDERRDLGPFARVLVAALSRLMGPMGRYWRSSIAAAYTPEEVSDFLTAAGFEDAEVRGGMIDLSIEARK